jgi:hypothetical protein
MGLVGKRRQRRERQTSLRRLKLQTSPRRLDSERLRRAGWEATSGKPGTNFTKDTKFTKRRIVGLVPYGQNILSYLTACLSNLAYG